MTEFTYFADIHSSARPNEAVIKHLSLAIEVDFVNKAIIGKATYTIENKKKVNQIILDCNNLIIEKITLDKKELETEFNLGMPQPQLGQALAITINATTEYITIYYKTGLNAAALLWLDPQQTSSKTHPFLFTQSEAILCRTWIPIQDSPGIRITYDAIVKVPPYLLALMSANNPQQKNQNGIYQFMMDKPIPAYLLALAVGDLSFKTLGARTGVYAEPNQLEKAAYEFADMEHMLTNAEKLYGEYAWGRYDVIVLPPSFPFGGMENPKLTFATPTILAGDRSLVSLIAHELAHSWSGNLVTNATWNDFWLNEGFTVYFERRIMEALEGKEYSQMLEVLGYHDLIAAINELKPEFTKLKMNLQGYDPDDGLSRVPYEKGYFLLRFIEENVGRVQFDIFLKNYFQQFAFQSMTTDQFYELLQTNLIQDASILDEIKIWLYEPGIPKSLIMSSSQRFEGVKKALQQWELGCRAEELNSKQWSSHEWEYFIRHLPSKLSHKQMASLDKAFSFTLSNNIEIKTAWLTHIIKNNYSPSFPELAAFLKQIGRRFHVLSLYKEMVKTKEGKERAKQIYQIARPGYHAVTQFSVDKALGIKSLATS